MNSVGHSCASKPKTGYSTADVASPPLSGGEGSLLFTVLLATLLLMLLLARILLAFFAARGHCCLVFILVFWFSSPDTCTLKQCLYSISVTYSCFHLLHVLFSYLSHQDPLVDPCRIPPWLFSCQDRPRLGGISSRSPFSSWLSAMGFSYAHPGGKLCAHLESCFLPCFLLTGPWTPPTCGHCSKVDPDLHTPHQFFLVGKCGVQKIHLPLLIPGYSGKETDLHLSIVVISFNFFDSSAFTLPAPYLSWIELAVVILQFWPAAQK